MLKFWCSGQCGKIFPRCSAAYLQGCNVTHIKVICKSLIYAKGALKFLAHSPNYPGVLDEIMYFFQLGHLRPQSGYLRGKATTQYLVCYAVTEVSEEVETSVRVIVNHISTLILTPASAKTC